MVPDHGRNTGYLDTKTAIVLQDGAASFWLVPGQAFYSIRTGGSKFRNYFPNVAKEYIHRDFWEDHISASVSLLEGKTTDEEFTFGCD
jgi:hypothetical protein